MAVMSGSHREIFHLVRLLRRNITRLDEAGPEPEQLRDIRRILYSLHAILGLHFAQEEELYAVDHRPAAGGTGAGMTDRTTIAASGELPYGRRVSASLPALDRMFRDDEPLLRDPGDQGGTRPAPRQPDDRLLDAAPNDRTPVRAGLVRSLSATPSSTGPSTAVPGSEPARTGIGTCSSSRGSR